jgi:probable rRNA maturation factor
LSPLNSSSSTTITQLTPAGVSTVTLRRWASHARRRLRLRGRIAVTIVTPALSQQLNAQYRRRRRPTNVLTFDYAHDKPAGTPDGLAGEIILCPSVIRAEARRLKEPYQSRLRMLIEHGLIHLVGLDHLTAKQQKIWERYEGKLL